MSTTVVINEVPKFNLSVQQGDGPAVTLSQPDAPALTLSMSGPQGPTGATGAAGPNSVTGSTTSDGTGTLSLSSLSLSTPLPLASGGTGGTTAGTARTNLGLGTADTPTFSNLTLATGTITVPQPLAFSQTWNSTATFTALQMNITDSGPANAASLLMDLRVGGNSRLKVSKAGTLTVSSSSNSYAVLAGSTSLEVRLSEGGNTAGVVASTFETRATTSASRLLGLDSTNIYLVSSGFIQWNNTTTNCFAAGDLFLLRDGQPNTLAQRNLGSAQEFRLYGTTNAAVTEYERLKLKYNSTTLSYQIGTEKGGTTTSPRPLEFQTDGTTRMTIAAAGTVSVAGNMTVSGTSTWFGAANPTNGSLSMGYGPLIGTFGYGTNCAIFGGSTWGGRSTLMYWSSATSAVLNGQLTAQGDMEITDSTKGVILKSPDGTRYRITVANGGTLTVTAV